MCPAATPTETKNYVKYAEEWHFGVKLGVWGGDCVCPDGRVYTAGDQGNLCGSIACHGGKQMSCNKMQGFWAFREVFCAAPQPHGPIGAPVTKKAIHDAAVAALSKSAALQGSSSYNTVTDNAEGVGEWGGTCTCPDGEIYLVGARVSDHVPKGQCGALACVGGVAGLCNHYSSNWAHREVICAPGPPLMPSPRPSPPPTPKPPPPKPPPPPSPPPVSSFAAATASTAIATATAGRAAALTASSDVVGAVRRVPPAWRLDCFVRRLSFGALLSALAREEVWDDGRGGEGGARRGGREWRQEDAGKAGGEEGGEEAVGQGAFGGGDSSSGSASGEEADAEKVCESGRHGR